MSRIRRRPSPNRRASNSWRLGVPSMVDLTDLRRTLDDEIQKQLSAIAAQKAGLYDLASQEEVARRQRRQGEAYLQGMLARLDVLQTLRAELDKGKAEQVPEKLVQAIPASVPSPGGDQEGASNTFPFIPETGPSPGTNNARNDGDVGRAGD